MCFSLRWRLFCVLGGIISRAEYSKSPSVSRETIPPRRLAEKGVKNWPGRRNRLPHPVCKPLDSKEGGADGFVCRPPGSQFFTASQLDFIHFLDGESPNIRPIRGFVDSFMSGNQGHTQKLSRG